MPALRLRVHHTTAFPAQDMMRVKRYMRRYKEERTRLVGPNCAGIITPARQCWDHAGHIYMPGHVGIVSVRARSATKPPRR